MIEILERVHFASLSRTIPFKSLNNDVKMGKKNLKIKTNNKTNKAPTSSKSWELNKNRLPKLVPEAQTYLHLHTIDDSDDGKAHGDFVN